VSRPPVITSLANPTVKLLTSLRLDKYRAEHGMFLVEGLPRLVEALRAGAAPKLIAYRNDSAADPDLAPVLRACTAAGGTAIAATAAVMAKIAHKDNPPAAVAAFAIVRRGPAEIKPLAGDLWIALERVRDPGNLGTVIRAADAAGAAGVLLIGPSCDAYGPEAVRASTGSIFHVPVFEGDETAFLALAASWPGEVVGTAASGAIDYRTHPYRPPAMIVMGTEQSGLSPAVAGACRALVRIPMHGRTESLNLAVAAGVMLFAVRGRLSP
jgi:TrmH family RNA methyltransferase